MSSGTKAIEVSYELLLPRNMVKTVDLMPLAHFRVLSLLVVIFDLLHLFSCLVNHEATFCSRHCLLDTVRRSHFEQKLSLLGWVSASFYCEHWLFVSPSHTTRAAKFRWELEELQRLSNLMVERSSGIAVAVLWAIDRKQENMTICACEL